MSFTFRPAVRENIHLLIGLAGTTGGGKTFTALRLATGLAAGRKIACIDTENGRMKHYAPREGEKATPGKTFDFDHVRLDAPYRPGRYLEAITAAEQAGYAVIVVDSVSHEHAGEGGLLDWHDDLLDEFVARAKNDTRPEWQIRDSNNMRAWIEPKRDHKAFVQKLLQVNAHVILCFRAESKVEMAKDDKGKTVIRPKESPIGAEGFMPIAEKNLPYEMTMSLLLTADAPGVPKPIKLEAQHRAIIDLKQQITERTGEHLAEWAAGAKKETMSLAHILTAINVAEKPEHITALTPHVKKLDVKEQEEASAAAHKKMAELKKLRTPDQRTPAK